jgi:hypothetical protein
MSNQPGSNYPGAAAVAGVTRSDDAVGAEQPKEDQGVPVGDADVQADIDRAKGDDESRDDKDDGGADWPSRAPETDEGVPVGMRTPRRTAATLAGTTAEPPPLTSA